MIESDFNSVSVLKVDGEGGGATKKNLLTFDYTGFLIGILIKACCNPHTQLGSISSPIYPKQ